MTRDQLKLLKDKLAILDTEPLTNLQDLRTAIWTLSETCSEILAHLDIPPESNPLLQP